VCVPSYSTPPRQAILFRVETKDARDGRLFTAHHRYSDFRALHEALVPLVMSLAPAFPVPKLMIHTEDALRGRMAALERYLQEAVGGAGEAAWPLLLCFLGATALAPALSERSLRRGFLATVEVNMGGVNRRCGYGVHGW